LTVHQFRHSCASDLIEAGASLPEVKGILGHAVLETTMRYTQVADPLRKEAMEKHPINEFLRDSMDGGKDA
jgi:site-specific recombinase XerD